MIVIVKWWRYMGKHSVLTEEVVVVPDGHAVSELEALRVAYSNQYGDATIQITRQRGLDAGPEEAGTADRPEESEPG